MIRFIDHTADIGFEIENESFDDLLIEAAKSMCNIIFNPDKVVCKSSKYIFIKSDSPEIMFHDFLDEIMQISIYDKFLPAKIEIINSNAVEGFFVEAGLHGEKYNPSVHEYIAEIKGVTYHQLTLEKLKNKWVGRIIFDV